MSERPLSLNDQLANAVAAVAVANDRLARTADITAQARREETAALNELNRAQKHFDDLVATVKKSAPHGSDWRRPASFPTNANDL